MPRTKDVVVPEAIRDRLDRVLPRLLAGISRGQARRLIAAGAVFLDGKRCRIASRIVRPGAHIRVATMPLDRAAPNPAVLFENDALLAVDKPPGMPSAPTQLAAAGTALDEVQRQLRRQRGQLVRLRAVHRLDRSTSGVLVFAKSAAAAAFFSRAFREQQVEKIYLAWVHGVPADEEGEIDLPLRVRGNRAVVARNGKPAFTQWRRLRAARNLALLEVRPRTGRMHQVRIHLAAAGHPVVGDKEYGSPPAPRLMLHAWKLVLPDPQTGTQIAIEAPLPDEMFEAPESSGPALLRGPS